MQILEIREAVEEAEDSQALNQIQEQVLFHNHLHSSNAQLLANFN